MNARPNTLDQVQVVPDELTLRRLLAILTVGEVESHRAAS